LTRGFVQFKILAHCVFELDTPVLHAHRESQNRWDEAYSGKVPETGR